MARKLLGAMLLMILLFGSGCWSKKEIETLAIISAVGVDQVEIDGRKKWQLALEIFQPLAVASMEGGDVGGGNQPVAWVVTSLGDTVAEAINNFSSRTPRILFFAHNSIIVLGKEIAEEVSLADILSLSFNGAEMRLRSWVLVSNKKALDVLTARWELEQDISKELQGIIEETSKRLSKTTTCNLKELGEAMATPGKDVIVGRIEVFPTPEPQSAEQEEEIEGQETNVRLHGSGVFSQGRLAGWFDDQETRGYLILSGNAKMTVMSLQLDQDEEFDASAQIIKIKSKITPEIHQGHASVKVDITGEAHLDEFRPSGEKFTPQFLGHIEEVIASNLKKEALLTIAKAKEYRADILGLGEKIYRKHPKYWAMVKDNWRDHFVNLPIEVEVDITLRRTGMFIEPIPYR